MPTKVVPNSARPIVPPAEALNKGEADISFTDHIVPVLKFEFNEKTVPSLLENLSSFESNTSRVITEDPAEEPVKTIFGYVALFLLVVILIFLSEFAILYHLSYLNSVSASIFTKMFAYFVT